MTSVKHDMNGSNAKKVVCIGGGTGTFVVLKGLKRYPVTLSVIVTMSDSGGSNKRIRDEFGLLPTSDIRQCLVALSDEARGPELMRKLFMYRYEKGRGIKGMTFGNLFMAALTDILGSQKEAIRQTSRVLRIRGNIIPVTYTDTNLFATYEDGTTVTEEHFIDEPKHDGRIRITDVNLKPKASANPDALSAIGDADFIILGPGDLYTSLIPNFLVAGIGKAIGQSKAKKIYICNLMTKYGQTYGFSAADHVSSVEKYIGKSLTHVVYNTAPLNEKALAVYSKMQELPVFDDLPVKSHYQTVRAPLVSRQTVDKVKSDSLVRSLIRHDSEALARVLMKIIENQV